MRAGLHSCLSLSRLGLGLNPRINLGLSPESSLTKPASQFG